MGSAFAVEDVPWFTGAFAFTPLWLLASADVGANPVATDNLLFGRSRFFLSFRHFVSLDSVLDRSRVVIITFLGVSCQAWFVSLLSRLLAEMAGHDRR
jgi:hypothetical protein